jgi:hypothetical protein
MLSLNNNADFSKFVSGVINSTCKDVSIEHNEKLIETGIDFINSGPDVDKPISYDDKPTFYAICLFQI